MGIRIKKNLCYALEISHKEHIIDDSRFQDWVTAYEDDEIYERPNRMFIPFLKWITDPEKKNEIVDILAQVNGIYEHDWMGVVFGPIPSARDFLKLSEEEQKAQVFHKFNINFIYDGEYGLPNIFGILPIEERSFYRRDDMIDYYEAGCTADGKVSWLDHREGRCGIYPHCMMIKIPGTDKIEISNNEASSLLSYKNDNSGLLPDRLMGGDYNRLIGLWNRKRQPIVSHETVKKMNESYRPEIHASVILWAYYVGLFKDWAKTINELRPCIYTYWS